MLGYPCIGKTTLFARDYNAIAIEMPRVHNANHKRCLDLWMLGYPRIRKTTLSPRDYNAITRDARMLEC